MKAPILLLPICALPWMPPILAAADPDTPPPAEQSSTDASRLFESATKYLKGDGVEKDERKGFELMSQAAAQGHVAAIAGLGYLYSAGIGTAIDYSEAALWFRKAAEKNHAISQLNLARLLVAVDKLPQPANEDEEKARWAEGVKWFRLAADQGLSEAQSSYGLLLLRGDCGVQTDSAAAARYLAPAAKAGVLEAMNALASMYQIGNGVPADPVEAERLFREAAMAGNAKAQANLGLFLETKVPQDEATRTESLAWLMIAEIGRDPVAVKVLATRLPATNPDDVAASRKKAGELRRAIYRQKARQEKRPSRQGK